MRRLAAATLLVLGLVAVPAAEAGTTSGLHFVPSVRLDTSQIVDRR